MTQEHPFSRIARLVYDSTGEGARALHRAAKATMAPKPPFSCPQVRARRVKPSRPASDSRIGLTGICASHRHALRSHRVLRVRVPHVAAAHSPPASATSMAVAAGVSIGIIFAMAVIMIDIVAVILLFLFLLPLLIVLRVRVVHGSRQRRTARM